MWRAGVGRRGRAHSPSCTGSCGCTRRRWPTPRTWSARAGRGRGRGGNADVETDSRSRGQRATARQRLPVEAKPLTWRLLQWNCGSILSTMSMVSMYSWAACARMHTHTRPVAGLRPRRGVQADANPTRARAFARAATSLRRSAAASFAQSAAAGPQRSSSRGRRPPTSCHAPLTSPDNEEGRKEERAPLCRRRAAAGWAGSASGGSRKRPR